MKAPYLCSIQVGKPKVVGVAAPSDVMSQSWSTGFYKEPVEGKVWLGRYNLSGDGQADLQHHGGAEKAVLAYSADHYPVWRSELDKAELSYGAFGENFTIAWLTEELVCIGDTFVVGDAHLQISQPRCPCWKISQRWQIVNLTERVQSTGRTGWYFRVLKEGYVEQGVPVLLLDRPFPQWTVARANEIMRHRHDDRISAAKLGSCPLLSRNWSATLCVSK